MKILQYQERAVKALVDYSIRMLEYPQDYQNLVFKAPTGSGKTIMATRVLADLHEALLAEGRPDAAFVWIAPQKLHLQSFEKLKTLFAENRRLSPILYDDIDKSEGVIKSGEILFVNWESVNKDSNLMVKDRENADSFFQIIERTRLEAHRPIYLIVDEEHRNWSKNADKSLKVVEKIHPKVELRISATPKTKPDQCYTIDRSEVIKEQMIKKGSYLNEDINVNNDDPNLNMHLLHKGLDMRQMIADEYKRLNVNINPLLLIQLPNDTSEVLTSEEKSLKDNLIRMLSEQYDISVDNGKLGIWLSGEKTIDDKEISRNDDLTQVLLFKQAIALGWDCPRAAVLLIFRTLKEETFTVQTLGRILRMPEQHFYPTDFLNYGHVYTDLSKDKITIAIEDTSYISKNSLQSLRREKLTNVSLPSFHQERRGEDQNRLGPDFKRVMLDEIATFMGMKVDHTLFTIEQIENWTPEEVKKYRDPLSLLGTTVEFNRKRMVERGIKMDVKAINVPIPKNLMIQNDEGKIDINKKNFAQFARTQGEIQRVYYAFCHTQVVRANFEPKKSTEKLAGVINELFEELFGMLEVDVPKIILSNDRNLHNVRKFAALIQRTLSRYARMREDRLKKKRDRSFKKSIWEVPAIRLYNNANNEVWTDVHNHATMPFIGLKNPSMPERHFTDFLEENADFIDWWYKNGDEGMTNFAIPYTNIHGEKALFYLDYIIRMKNGKVLLFDTKSEDSDPNGAKKNNALKDYIKDFNDKNDGIQLDGGIIIEDKATPGLWRYSAIKIDNTHDTSQWKGFFPDQYK